MTLHHTNLSMVDRRGGVVNSPPASLFLLHQIEVVGILEEDQPTNKRFRPFKRVTKYNLVNGLISQLSSKSFKPQNAYLNISWKFYIQRQRQQKQQQEQQLLSLLQMPLVVVEVVGTTP